MIFIFGRTYADKFFMVLLISVSKATDHVLRNRLSSGALENRAAKSHENTLVPIQESKDFVVIAFVWYSVLS